MKKLFLLFAVLSVSTVFAQFKSDTDVPLNVRNGISNGSPSSLLLGFLDMNKFNMNHSVSMSYSSFGGNGLALGVYTNSMSYQFNDNFDIQVDASIVNSPYSSFGDDFASKINGIYLSRAQINYRPSENFNLTIQYNNSPLGYYYYDYDPFYGRFLRP
ncbi:MAG: hypothetical protein V1720_02695 [bacterium]